MGVIALNEVLVHGWDLASATGQSYDVDEVAAQRHRPLGATGRDPRWRP